jgi:hypothetical protein
MFNCVKYRIMAGRCGSGRESVVFDVPSLVIAISKPGLGMRVSASATLFSIAILPHGYEF